MMWMLIKNLEFKEISRKYWKSNEFMKVLRNQYQANRIYDMLRINMKLLMLTRTCKSGGVINHIDYNKCVGISYNCKTMFDIYGSDVKHIVFCLKHTLCDGLWKSDGLNDGLTEKWWSEWWSGRKMMVWVMVWAYTKA